MEDVWFDLVAKDGYLPSIYWAGSRCLLGEEIPQDVKKRRPLRTATEDKDTFTPGAI